MHINLLVVGVNTLVIWSKKNKKKLRRIQNGIQIKQGKILG